MSGTKVGLLFLGISAIVAILLLTGTISRIQSVGVFAVALVTLGLVSQGFRRKRS
jgi:hypothetical protein